MSGSEQLSAGDPVFGGAEQPSCRLGPGMVWCKAEGRIRLCPTRSQALPGADPGPTSSKEGLSVGYGRVRFGP